MEVVAGVKIQNTLAAAMSSVSMSSLSLHGSLLSSNKCGWQREQKELTN